MSHALSLRGRLSQALQGKASTHYVSLHFKDDAREQSFLKDYNKQLQTNFCFCCLVGSLGFGVYTIRHIYIIWTTHKTPPYGDPALHPGQLFNRRVNEDIGAMQIAAVAVMTVVGLASSRPRFWQMNHSVVEWLIVLLEHVFLL